MQIAALYLVNLLVTMAAYAGLAVAALAVTPAGVPLTLTLQPTTVAVAAMVAMSSHFLLAFLPLLMAVTFPSSQVKFATNPLVCKCFPYAELS